MTSIKHIACETAHRDSKELSSHKKENEMKKVFFVVVAELSVIKG